MVLASVLYVLFCQVIEPDDRLVSALHKRGVSLNRARRACVATGNSSREAALAWCVEHAGDPAMDAPLPPQARRTSGGTARRYAVGTRTSLADRAESGGDGGNGDDGRERFRANAGKEDHAGGWGAGAMHRTREEGARAAHEIASSALETYVRARLSAMRKGGGGGNGFESSNMGGMGSAESPTVAASQEEVGELVFVLSSFRTRASLGAAEDRARLLLLPGADLVRFAGDGDYRQQELERAASQATNGKVASDIVVLGREYPGTDVWSVAAAGAATLLGPAYSRLRRKGLAAAAAAARIDAELRTGSNGDGGGGVDLDKDSKTQRSVDGGLLAVLNEEAHGQSGALQVARDVFIRDADGTDLHHMDLLLRVMTEGAAATAMGRGQGRGGAEDDGMMGGKSEAERRLNAHCGLVRRLLKAAPPGLDYKRLLGRDPLADPLADPDPNSSSAASLAPNSVTQPSKRSAAGLAAARARVMTELRSVMELEHAPALSKLAKRVPGLTGSAVYLATAQRVLCGETGRLSPEALDLLRGTGAGGGYNVEGREEEADAASVSVYHLVSPLLPKMAAEDLVEAVTTACAPYATGDAGVGSFPCRKHAGKRTAGSALPPISSSPYPFPDTMEPLRLTVRCRRRLLAEGVAALAASKGLVVAGPGGEAASAGASRLAAEEHFGRLGALLTALDAAPTTGPTRSTLEAAWALTRRVPQAPVVGDIDENGRQAERPGMSASAAEKATADALVDMAVMGATPAAVETVCSSMRAALGLSAGHMESSTAVVAGDKAGDVRRCLLDSSRVYAMTTSALLARLVRGTQEERTLALGQLRTICIAVTTATRSTGSVGSVDRPVSPGDPSSVVDGTPATRAWGTIAPSLEVFSREEGGLVEDFEQTGGGGAAAAAVYRARAEVLTLLKTFDRPGYVDIGVSVFSSGEGGRSGDPPAVNRTSSDGTTRVDDWAVELDTTDNGDNGSETVSGGVSVDNGSSRGDGGDDGGRKLSPSPPALSLSFLRVAELTMEAFSARVSPKDVESWQARSVLMQTLTSHAAAAAATSATPAVVLGDFTGTPHIPSAPASGESGGGSWQPGQTAQRLHALANILGAWESELQSDSSPAIARSSLNTSVSVTTTTAVDRVRRMRVEATARSLLERAGVDAISLPPTVHERDGGMIEEDSWGVIKAGSGAEVASLNEFMRQWWSKLLEVGVDAREWDFVIW